MTPSSQSDNPLGLNLDFMFGRGFLWAERHRLSDWISLESLRMEIPDLQFPFDARGGLDRFRHTRCLVREVEIAISEVGLGDLLQEAAAQLEGFEDLQVRFLEDAAHFSVRLNSMGTDTHISFRAALVPPEPTRADEVHLSLYDYRAFGPLPYPSRLVVHELLTGLLNTSIFRSPGRGESFTVGMAGDIIRFRPLKLAFLYIFPRVGWKLPNLAGVMLESSQIRPGVLTVRAVDDEPHTASATGAEQQLAGSKEGARALAAYEAKELFSHADRTLFDGDVRQALSLLSNYRDVYGMNPSLVARILDCLVADASPANLADAEALRRELVAEEPKSLQAALVGPTLALARRRPQDAIEAYQELSKLLRDRDETRDWILCELALAELLVDREPREAATRLKEVLKRAPRHRRALERLREIYEETGLRAGLEETLKRLTGVYTDRRRLKETYLQLARHLMEREGDLGEARMYLEKVLRLDGTHLEALHALGRSYVMGDEPLRALKAFGSAARTARAEERFRLAARLYLNVGELWNEQMENARQALLAFRQALSALDELDEPDDALRTRALRGGAELCEQLNRPQEAIEMWREALQLLQRGVERAEREFPPIDTASADSEEFDERRELIRANRRLARLYDRRGRMSAAASHFRRVLEMSPGDDEALEWLEQFLRRGGRPEELIELYESQIREADDEENRLELIAKLADLYAALDFVQQAQEAYRRILRVDPTRSSVRRRLVELLEKHQRFSTLREAMMQLVEQVRDRRERTAILMDLAAACEKIDELGEAVEASMEAVELSVGERQPLEELCRLLRIYVEQRGAQTRAPVGSTTAGRLLEKMLLRLSEMTPSSGRQREVLLEVAMMADKRGDSAAAAEARQRAQAMEGPDDDEFDGVDERLDAMLADFDEFDESNASPGDDAGESAPTGETVDLPKPPEKSDDLNGDSPSPQLSRPSNVETGGGDDEADDNLSSFRRRLASVVQNPSQLPDPDEIEQKKAVARARTPETEPTESAEAETSKRWDNGEPETVRMPAEQFESLREESSSAEVDESAGVSNSKTDSAEEARHAVEQARHGDQPRELAEAIDHLVTLDENTDSEMVTDDRAAELSKEAGELLYYDLDDASAARKHLERVRRLDPDGRGQSPEVLNALESIYEETGDVDARVRLLEQRLETTDAPQMQTTYRLLIAQTLWNQNEDAEGARRWLREVLETEPHHEGAHRLLAEIAEGDRQWEAVADHLEKVVAASAGGIEAVETQRKLARVLLRRLDEPERALDHYRSVLDAAPGDAQALEEIKETQGILGDWKGYVGTLGHELGLLIGQPEGLGVDEMSELSAESVESAVQVPASEIVADAAHILDEQLDDAQRARRLWGVAYRLWPEHADALQRRIELDRQLEAHEDLADDLESFAALVLDDRDRFDALVEAADLLADRLDEPGRARPLYTEALALVQDADDPPKQTGRVRRQLERLGEP